MNPTFNIGDIVKIKGKYEADWRGCQAQIIGINKEVKNGKLTQEINYTIYLDGEGETDGWYASDLELVHPCHNLEPDAVRFGWNGYGYDYIDSSDGSDWRTRHHDAEPMYSESCVSRIATALEFYADASNWEAPMGLPKARDDRGNIARISLGRAPLKDE